MGWPLGPRQASGAAPGVNTAAVINVSSSKGTAGQKQYLGNGGTGFDGARLYRNGAIIWHSGQSRARWVHGNIFRKYIDVGQQGSFLGFPTSDEYEDSRTTVGTRQNYQGGCIAFDVNANVYKAASGSNFPCG